MYKKISLISVLFLYSFFQIHSAEDDSFFTFDDPSVIALPSGLQLSGDESRCAVLDSVDMSFIPDDLLVENIFQSEFAADFGPLLSEESHSSESIESSCSQEVDTNQDDDDDEMSVDTSNTSCKSFKPRVNKKGDTFAVFASLLSLQKNPRVEKQLKIISEICAKKASECIERLNSPGGRTICSYCNKPFVGFNQHSCLVINKKK